MSSPRMQQHDWLGFAIVLGALIWIAHSHELEVVKHELEPVNEFEIGPYEAQWRSMKTMKKNLEERIDELEKKVAHLEKPETLLDRLNDLFKDPPSYLQSFIVNLSHHKYKKRLVARNIDKWK